MRHSKTILALSITATAAVSATASADTPAADEGTGPTVSAEVRPYSFGARVGGYGFRREDGDRRNAWDECRMNGLGVFGERRLGGPLFVEAGLDLYFSESFPMPQSEEDLPIDRVSTLVTTAIGLRADGPWRTSGFAQLGVGLELTRVSVPYGEDRITDQQALPAGFLGLGAEIRVGARTHLGMNLRTHVMGNFDYDPEDLEMQPGWTTPPAADEVFAPSPDVAAQGQFYVRRDL
jgi:hypothetical protein